MDGYRKAPTSFADHLRDGLLRARVLYRVGRYVRVAGGSAIVVLHQTRVADTPVGRRRAHTAARLLRHDSKDEAVVDLGLLGDLLDGIVDGADFLGRVVWDWVAVVVPEG